MENYLTLIKTDWITNDSRLNDTLDSKVIKKVAFMYDIIHRIIKTSAWFTNTSDTLNEYYEVYEQKSIILRSRIYIYLYNVNANAETEEGHMYYKHLLYLTLMLILAMINLTYHSRKVLLITF